MAKSSFRVLAEALVLNKLKNIKLPKLRTEQKSKKITSERLRNIVKEEFGKVKNVEDVEVQKKDGGWGDAEISNYLEWLKTLDIKEVFNLKRTK